MSGDVQLLLGLLLAPTGFATLFVTTAVGALAIVLGLLTSSQTRSDAAVLGPGFCGVRPLRLVWVITRTQVVLGVLCVAGIGFSAYRVARPPDGSALTLAAASTAVAVCAGAAVCAAWIASELPRVVESIFAAAALQAVRRMRYVGSPSGQDTAARTANLFGATGVAPHGADGTRSACVRSVTEGDDLQGRRVNALATLPQVSRLHGFNPLASNDDGVLTRSPPPQDEFTEELEELNPLADADLR